MLFITWEWIALRPSLFLQVRNNMLPGNCTRFFTKELNDFSDSSLMVSNATVPHFISFSTLEFIKPLMYFFIRFAK